MPINSSITQLVQITTTPGDDTVTAAKVVDGSLGINELANACISGAKLGAQTVQQGHIGNLAIQRSHLASAVISGNSFAANAIVPHGHIALNSTLAKTVSDNNYLVVKSDRGKVIKCDASGGAFTILLDAAATLGNGFEVTFVKVNDDALAAGNAVTINADGSETINGALTNVLCAKYSHLTIVCDGTEWFVKSCNDYIEVRDSSFTNWPVASDTHTDEESISLPPGEWEITGSMGFYVPTSPGQVRCGIGTESGTSTAGLEEGLNYMIINATWATTDLAVPAHRVVLTATTTYYLKGMINFGGGTPQTAGRINARRLR